MNQLPAQHQQEVMNWLEIHPLSTARQIAEALGLKQDQALGWLNTMYAHGFVDRQSDKTAVRGVWLWKGSVKHE